MCVRVFFFERARCWDTQLEHPPLTYRQGCAQRLKSRLTQTAARVWQEGLVKQRFLGDGDHGDGDGEGAEES